MRLATTAAAAALGLSALGITPTTALHAPACFIRHDGIAQFQQSTAAAFDAGVTFSSWLFLAPEGSGLQHFLELQADDNGPESTLELDLLRDLDAKRPVLTPQAEAAVRGVLAAGKRSLFVVRGVESLGPATITKTNFLKTMLDRDIPSMMTASGSNIDLRGYPTLVVVMFDAGKLSGEEQAALEAEMAAGKPQGAEGDRSKAFDPRKYLTARLDALNAKRASASGAREVNSYALTARISGTIAFSKPSEDEVKAWELRVASNTRCQKKVGLLSPAARETHFSTAAVLQRKLGATLEAARKEVAAVATSVHRRLPRWARALTLEELLAPVAGVAVAIFAVVATLALQARKNTLSNHVEGATVGAEASAAAAPVAAAAAAADIPSPAKGPARRTRSQTTKAPAAAVPPPAPVEVEESASESGGSEAEAAPSTPKNGNKAKKAAASTAKSNKKKGNGNKRKGRR